jgi:GTP-dependent phosphoenolpyruvate carboxykinase
MVTDIGSGNGGGAVGGKHCFNLRVTQRQIGGHSGVYYVVL